MKPLMVFSYNPNYISTEVMEKFMQDMRELGYNCLAIAHQNSNYAPIYYVVREEPKGSSIWDKE